MECSVQEFFEKHQKATSEMKRQTPQVMTGFGTLFTKIMEDGALTVKEKEFIALGIGVAIQCEPCIRLHVKKCLDMGATREEVLEAASVAVMMGGGPAFTHIPMVIETLDSLESKQARVCRSA